ncbi:sodium-dependent multivitamin transporter-like [Homarus americanus]|nr:sodium-dependent multivitamin transporter-like [Homarus americanus]
MIGFVVIIIKGVADVGSVQQVWEVAVKHNRAGPQAYTYGYDPLKRHTVANIIIGGIFLTAVQYGSSQTSVQRFASTKSLSQAYLSLVMMIPLFILAISLAIFAGLVIFATYEGCDPLAAGLIAHKDQILPFFVMDRLSSITGLPGLFIATLFSGSLSTISSGVNSQAAVTWEDVFAKIPSCASLSKRTQVWLTKLLAFGYGILAVGFAFLAGSLGGVLQAAIVVTSSVGGPLLGVFIMALFMPFTNSKGACGGMIFGTGIGLVFSFGSSITGVKLEMLPTSTEACPANFTIPPPPSTPPLRVSDLEFPEKILCLSYTQLGPLGTLMAIVIGVLISLATGRAGGRRIDKSLVHPWIRWTLPDPTTVTRKTNGHSYDKISTQL